MYPSSSGGAADPVFPVPRAPAPQSRLQTIPPSSCLEGSKAFVGLFRQQRPNPNSLFRAPIDEGFGLQTTFLAKISGFRDYPQIMDLQNEIKA